MDDRTSWVDSQQTLREALDAIGPGALGLDTEADSLHHYPEKVCLIQISTGDRDWLIDPLAGIDLSPLGTVLADRSMLKILHGADYDLRVLQRDFGFQVAGLYDTMIAARLVGETAFGLSTLLKHYFDVELDKRYQRADWSLRPLTAEMRRYAALDTRHLGALAERLSARLEQLGRLGWAEDEFRRLECVRWTDTTRDGEAFRRVRGSGRLEPRKLAVLRELVALRETTARRSDRPPYRVMPDSLLLELALQTPRHAAELASVPGVPTPWRRPGRQRQLLETIARGLSLAEQELPQASISRRRRRDARLEDRLKRIARRRDRLAAELGLEPSLIASRSVLEKLLTRDDPLQGGPPEEVRAWQWRLLEPLLAQEFTEPR